MSPIAARQQAAALLDAIFDAAPDGILLCGDDGRITHVNARAAAMFGHGADELIGEPIERLVPLRHRAAHADLRGGYARDPRPRPMGPNRRLTALRKDGSELPVEIGLGRPGLAGAEILCIVRDVSERERADEALRAAQEQLRQAQKMDAIGRLAGGVAHDFNNLLTVILSCADLILETLGGAHPAADDAREIQLAARRAADLTHRLLAISRRQMLKPKIVDPAAVVTNMHNLLGRLIGEQIVFETRLAQVRSIQIDPGQLELVIMNLAINARDAMPEGGKLTIELTDVELGDGEIEDMDLDPGPYVRISVSDTGEGIDADTLPRIFEPFFTTKEPGKGTGLGLSTVFGIIRQSGGLIVARSRPGAGTTFDLLLPIAGKEPSATAAAPGDLVRGGTETILLVEDEDAPRRLLSSVLSRAGYAVITARSAREALSLVEQRDRPIDLLVTDVIMPGMSGKLLAEHIRRRCPETRILFISGYANDMTDKDLSTLDATFVAKPITAHSFARSVREVLDAV
ncbi:MAG: ATP-binding protein [Byssovorax sp.]